MKRKIWIGLAGILCAGLLAGCGKEGENSGSKDAGEGEKKVLTVLLNGTASDAFVDDYQEIIDRFNEENNYGRRYKETDFENSTGTVCAYVPSKG